MFEKRMFPSAPPERRLSFIPDLIRAPLAAAMQTKSQHDKFKKTMFLHIRHPSLNAWTSAGLPPDQKEQCLLFLPATDDVVKVCKQPELWVSDWGCQQGGIS